MVGSTVNSTMVSSIPSPASAMVAATFCKSPKSWKGSYAEQLVDLDHVAEATVFFTGTARSHLLPQWCVCFC
jgi:hypothetical protein